MALKIKEIATVAMIVAALGGAGGVLTLTGGLSSLEEALSSFRPKSGYTIEATTPEDRDFTARLKNANGEPIFPGEHTLQLFTNRLRDSLSKEQIAELAAYKSPNGEVITEWDLPDLVWAGATREMLDRLSIPKGADGESVISLWQIADILPEFKESPDNFDQIAYINKFAQKIGDRYYTPLSKNLSYIIKSAYHLGLNPEDIKDIAFKESSKPKALVILPATDYNGAFLSEGSTKFYKEIASAYNTVFQVAATEAQGSLQRGT